MSCKGDDAANRFAVRMRHFGTQRPESRLFLWSFQHHAQQYPHKMRLKRYFSTECWYKIPNTAGKS
jgi:hypothetical protein